MYNLHRYTRGTDKTTSSRIAITHHKLLGSYPGAEDCFKAMPLSEQPMLVDYHSNGLDTIIVYSTNTNITYIIKEVY